MPSLALLVAMTGLLLTPGPTNTLVLLSAADRGFRATLRLIPVELAAYLCTVTPLFLLAEGLGPQLAPLRPAIASAAGVWVLILALNLWRAPLSLDGAPLVTSGKVFVTTLLNPKAMIFGLVLLPGTPALTGLSSFAVLVVLVALLWAAFGYVLPRQRDSRLPDGIRRAAALWLVLLSAGLFAKALAA